jgi:UDP-N-acetylmuramoyl-tripeptide--D-alanyl-D-alanine ligase
MEITELYQKYLESGKVSTDTRQITSGSVFFALKGPSFNANEFAGEALSKGASYAVIDEKEYLVNDRCILVDDGLLTLQQLARFHRSKLSIPVLGLTGSNGKTTSKELVRDVLSKKFKTIATKGNLNNHIGVPLTVLSIDQTHEMAVIEMGANHVGEIAFLSSISNPTHGFITNIGKAHIGTFGGFENIIRGKSELYQHLISTRGTVFINSQNPILANMAKRFENPLFYPAPGDYYHCELLDTDPYLVFRAENGEVITTQIIGSYNFENIAAALCIGKYFGVETRAANAAIAAYVSGSMRSEVKKMGTNTIILDAYNANPTSMEAALDSLSSMKEKHKVAILGDMYELEEETEREHARIGTLLKEKNITEAWLCGPHMKAALKQFPSAKHFETKEALITGLKSNPIVGAVILIKASRGMALEKIVEYI